MRIAIGCDHLGFPIKASVIEALESEDHAVLDQVGVGLAVDQVRVPELDREPAAAHDPGGGRVGLDRGGGAARAHAGGGSEPMTVWDCSRMNCMT